ncbi:uncharacterized protein BDZ99DRAFT_560251 [Mytilinidion resinicola]|uniref:Uncharacterized protein n=1 Tax=Mytilinidion resinicola TaxID=574789 RepID=A0A6A6YTB4_9PEZI|nr:uncharacterized protein BDZ99DRAFT_560251 [Mytilinidion resinicola]KAF2811808.1 hypothetical protein BDZ99DRAFT_560251 [Mytilinidion resinicola]
MKVASLGPQLSTLAISALREPFLATFPEVLLSTQSSRDFLQDFTWSANFTSYTGLVEQYSQRKLSYRTDALNAFSGIVDLSQAGTPPDSDPDSTLTFDVLHFTTETTKRSSFYFTCMRLARALPSGKSNCLPNWTPLFETESMTRHCGILYAGDRVPILHPDDGSYEYILLSRSLYPGDTAEGKLPPEFTYGLKINRAISDHELYEPSKWCLSNIMLIRWNTSRTRAERIAIGQVHEKAWEDAMPQNNYIELV